MPGIKTCTGKTKGKVFDYIDSKVEVLRAAAAARRRVYGA